MVTQTQQEPLYLPTSQEIAEGCAEARGTWTASERLYRREQCDMADRTDSTDGVIWSKDVLATCAGNPGRHSFDPTRFQIHLDRSMGLP